MLDKFEEVSNAASRLRIKDARLKKDVLSIGPCPGLWKTYYAATLRSDTVREVEKLDLSEYLGVPLPSGITKKKLGENFESWVKAANLAYNRFLETQQESELGEVKGVIGEYYTKMAQLHSVESLPVERAKTVLIMEEIELPKGVLLYALNPDGIFIGGQRGAIFESKLSRPDYPEFLNDIATYAIALERVVQNDVDSAIVLHSDYPHGKHVATKIYLIQDSNVSDVSRNIERFLRLVQISEIQRPPEGVFQKLKSTLGFSSGSWKDFLIRPEGLPETNKRVHCPECIYRKICYEEGGEPDGPKPASTGNQ